MSDNIPFEIQVEIIKNLPVKSLIQFRSVSKPWKSMIDSPDFIAGYTIHTPAQPQHLLVRYVNLSSEETYVSIVDDDTFPRNKVSLTVPQSVSLLRDLNVIGTSHGLICLFGYHSGTARAVIWNPSIRKSVAIDVPDLYPDTAIGFGVCPATNDPKIVKINDTRLHGKMKGRSFWQVEVYSLSSRVWRNSFGNLSGNTLLFIRPHPQVTVDGFVYWLGVAFLPDLFEFNHLVSFELSTEVFREIYLPSKVANPVSTDLCLFKRSDYLAVLKLSTVNNECIYEVWMMENDVFNSFKKLFTIKTLREFRSSGLPYEFRRSGGLMMRIIDGDAEDSESLIACEPLVEYHNDVGIKAQINSLRVCSYTESLLLLD